MGPCLGSHLLHGLACTHCLLCVCGNDLWTLEILSGGHCDTIKLRAVMEKVLVEWCCKLESRKLDFTTCRFARNTRKKAKACCTRGSTRDQWPALWRRLIKCSQLWMLSLGHAHKLQFTMSTHLHCCHPIDSRLCLHNHSSIAAAPWQLLYELHCAHHRAVAYHVTTLCARMYLP